MTKTTDRMHISRALLLALAVPLLAAGCASVATSHRALDVMEANEREVFGDIERAEFGKRLQVRLPAKLAVSDLGGGRDGGTWDDGTDARRLVQAVRGLAQDTQTYVDVVSVPAGGADGTDRLEDLRRRAAGHQADLQVVITRREQVREGGRLGFLKLLILPMLFVPTEDDDVTLTVRALVRDVRNGLIYTTFDDHREVNVLATAAGEEAAVRRAADALYDDAVAALRESLARKLSALERSASGGASGPEVRAR